MKHVTNFRKMSVEDMAAFVALALEANSLPAIPSFDTKAKGVALTSAAFREGGLDLELGEDGELSVVQVAPTDDQPGPADEAPEADEPALTSEDYTGIGLDDPAEGEAEGEADEAGADEAGADEAGEATIFVKLAKEDLPARGTPEREAYRKARRKAARDARKARQAA